MTIDMGQNRCMLLSALIIIGILLSGCRDRTTPAPSGPGQIENRKPTQSPTSGEESADLTTVSPEATETARRLPQQPPIRIPEAWQPYSLQSGLTLSAPGSWVDTSKLAGIDAISEKLQQPELLILTDTPDTSIQLVTGREFDQGAFVIAMPIPDREIEHPLFGSVRRDEPALMLGRILNRLGVQASGVELSSGLHPTANIELLEDPIGNLVAEAEGKGFYLSVVDVGISPAILILAGITTEHVDSYDELVRTVIQSARFEMPPERVTETGIRLLDEGNRDPIIGQIGGRGTDTWGFRRQATSGSYATITAQPLNTTTDLKLSLRSPSGQTLIEIDHGLSGDPELIPDLFLETEGLYILEVSEQNRIEGGYQLTLALNEEAVYSGGGTLGLGESITQALDPTRPDRWYFEGEAGDPISIILTPLEEYDPLFSLFDPEGNLIAKFDESFVGDIELLANYALPFTGRYEILVQSFSESAGSYKLTVDRGHQVGAVFHDAGDLNPNVIKTEMLMQEEIHIWFFEGEKGEDMSLTVRPISSPVNLNLLILTESRERIQFTDQTGDGATETARFTIPENGTYIAVLQDVLGRSGDYDILLEQP